MNNKCPDCAVSFKTKKLLKNHQKNRSKDCQIILLTRDIGKQIKIISKFRNDNNLLRKEIEKLRHEKELLKTEIKVIREKPIFINTSSLGPVLSTSKTKKQKQKPKYKIKEYKPVRVNDFNRYELYNLCKFVDNHGFMEGYIRFIKNHFLNNNIPNIYVKDNSRRIMIRYINGTWESIDSTVILDNWRITYIDLIKKALDTYLPVLNERIANCDHSKADELSKLIKRETRLKIMQSDLEFGSESLYKKNKFMKSTYRVNEIQKLINESVPENMKQIIKETTVKKIVPSSIKKEENEVQDNKLEEYSDTELQDLNIDSGKEGVSYDSIDDSYMKENEFVEVCEPLFPNKEES